MSEHLRRWGAVYILAALFLASWAGQFWAQLVEFTADQAEHGQAFEWAQFWPQFAEATLENWQSEWAQLLTQALLISAFSRVLFRKGDEDQRRLEAKVDRLLERG
jgi:hypothetical protein